MVAALRVLPSVSAMPEASPCTATLWPRILMAPLPTSTLDAATRMPSRNTLWSLATAPMSWPLHRLLPQATTAPPMSSWPPLSSSVDERIATAPPTSLLSAPRPTLWLPWPARSVSDSGAPSLRTVEKSSVMLRWALRVRLTGLLGAGLSVALSIRMSPLPGPALVLTLTLLLALSAASSVAVLSTATLPLLVKLGPPLIRLSTAPLVMTMSCGSSSHWPLRPAGASVRSDAGRASSQPPEVSMKPPSPPSAPPRALKLP